MPLLSLSLCLIMLSGCGPSQKKLAETAKTSAEYGEDGLAAVRKLTDQTLLVDVANHARSELVRSAAIGKLTDQAILADIAKDERKGWRERAAAMGGLTNQAFVANIIENTQIGNGNLNEIFWVIQQLTDQTVLADIIKKASNPNNPNHHYTPDDPYGRTYGMIVEAAQQRLDQLQGKRADYAPGVAE